MSSYIDTTHVRIGELGTLYSCVLTFTLHTSGLVSWALFPHVFLRLHYTRQDRWVGHSFSMSSYVYTDHVRTGELGTLSSCGLTFTPPHVRTGEVKRLRIFLHPYNLPVAILLLYRIHIISRWLYNWHTRTGDFYVLFSFVLEVMLNTTMGYSCLLRHVVITAATQLCTINIRTDEHKPFLECVCEMFRISSCRCVFAYRTAMY